MLEQLENRAVERLEGAEGIQPGVLEVACLLDLSVELRVSWSTWSGP